MQYPVPIHICNAPTKLLRELDYGKVRVVSFSLSQSTDSRLAAVQEYRYEPSFAHPVHQEFFPPPLRSTRLLSPPPSAAPVAETSVPKPNGAALDVTTPASAPRNGVLEAVPPQPRWTPSQPPERASEQRLAPRDPIGPYACQRVWQVGARAVDLDLLEEWERERNDGKPWEGRAQLMRTLGLEEEAEVADDLPMEEPAPAEQPESEVVVEAAAKPEAVDKATQTSTAPRCDASTSATTAAEPGPSAGSTSGGQPTETTPAPPRRRAGRFRETVQAWDPTRLLSGTDDGSAPPAHAVVLLNVALHGDHLHTFEHLWNGGEWPVLPSRRLGPLADAAYAASYRVCADGGANRLFDAYFASPSGSGEEAVSDPHVIVGDLDSLRAEVRRFFEERGVNILERPSQYATDLQKSIHAVEDVEKATRAAAPGATAAELELVIYGGLSGRLDQTMHTLHVLWLLAPGVVNPRGVEDPNETASAEEQRGGKLKKRQRTWVVSDNSLAWVLPKVSRAQTRARRHIWLNCDAMATQGKHELHLSHASLGKTCGLLPIGTGAEGVSITTTGLEWDLGACATA